VIAAESRTSSLDYLIRNRPGYVLGRVILYAVVIVGAIIFSIPFFWLMSTSFKTSGEVFVDPPIWIPQHLEWDNFFRPFRTVNFAVFYKNTMIITVVDILATLLTASITAFAFARMRFRGRDKWFVVLLSTMMLPGQVTLVPHYVLWTKLHLVNTLWPLIIPSFFAGPFNVFLLRQFMMTIPNEMDDAARMDGATWFQIYYRIIVPLSAAAMGVVAIFNFTFHWNDFFGPLIYLNTPDKFTVALGLQLFQSRYNVDVPATMAMTFLSIIPVLIVFFVSQRSFIQGIVVSGIKG